MARRWYAVQVGKEDTDCGCGSTVKREAIKMARAYHKIRPDEQIRIAICTTESDYVTEEKILYEGIF